MAFASREAALTLAAADIELRNAALLAMARVLNARKDEIFTANEADVAEATSDGLAAPLLKRLAFREEKLTAVTADMVKPGADPSHTDNERCINCMRCVEACPMNSRALPEMFRAMITKMLNEHAAGYKKPVVFL